MAKKDAPSLIADNRKARHDFNIHETYEAGIALTGTEIKSIRQGKLNLKDSFIRIDKGEVLLMVFTLVLMNKAIALIMSLSEHVNY